MGPVECLTCGKVFDGRDGDFCSDDCADDYVPEDIEYDDDLFDEEYETCYFCGDEFCLGECTDEALLPEEDV